MRIETAQRFTRSRQKSRKERRQRRAAQAFDEQELALRIHLQPDRLALLVDLEVDHAHYQPELFDHVANATLEIRWHVEGRNPHAAQVSSPVHVRTLNQDCERPATEDVHPDVTSAGDVLLVDCRRETDRLLGLKDLFGDEAGIGRRGRAAFHAFHAPR